MAELKQLWKNDRLEFHGSAAPYKNYYTFKELLNTCYAKEWIPYCKKPFDGAESVIRYLGKYTHRIAISNYRIKGMTESTVTFSAKDYKKPRTLERDHHIRRGIYPSIFNACSSKTFCTYQALWSSFIQK